MICFVLNYYYDWVKPRELLIERIQDVYASSPPDKILLVSDEIEHLKQPGQGGAWTHRYLSQALETGADHIIKIDPDTEVLKRAENLPEGEVIFCRVTEHDLIQETLRVPAGGALGFTRSMAERIVNEKYFLDPRLVNNARYNNYHDLMLMDLVRWHGLALIDRTDFACARRAVTEASTFYHR